MYHYNPTTALEELNEDAALPNPVHFRDMMLRAHLGHRALAGVQPHLRGVSETLRRAAEVRTRVAAGFGSGGKEVA